jgi:hypothetical protein
MIPHLVGITGLLIGALGGVGLVFCQREPYAGSPLTAEQLKSQWSWMPGEQWRYRRHVWGFWASVVAVPVGAILGVSDLLHG